MLAGFIALTIFLLGIVTDILLLRRAILFPERWHFKAHRIRSRPWDWHDAAELVIVFLTLTMILSYSLKYIPEQVLHSSVFMFFQLTVLPATAITIIVHMLYRKRSSLRRAFGFRPRLLIRNIYRGIVCYFAIMPFVMMTSFIYMRFLKDIGYEIEQQTAIKLLVDPLYPPWIHATLLLMAVVSAPVIEEAVFRGIILPAVMKDSNVVIAVILVSVLFSAIHVHMPSFLTICVLAMGLSAGYIVTGSLTVPIVTHAVFNFVSITAFLLLRNHLPQF